MTRWLFGTRADGKAERGSTACGKSSKGGRKMVASLRLSNVRVEVCPSWTLTLIAVYLELEGTCTKAKVLPIGNENFD